MQARQKSYLSSPQHSKLPGHKPHLFPKPDIFELVKPQGLGCLMCATNPLLLREKLWTYVIPPYYGSLCQGRGFDLSCPSQFVPLLSLIVEGAVQLILSFFSRGSYSKCGCRLDASWRKCLQSSPLLQCWTASSHKPPI